jgi:hypothetical protein
MAAFLQTLEIRWFGDRPLAAAARRWFESLGADACRRSERRSDRYVTLPAVTDLGLKFRGDQGLDLKARLDEIGIAELRRDGECFAAGVVETWAKWSYSAGEYPALGATLGRLETIEVGKERWEYLYDLAPGRAGAPLDLSEGPLPQVERGMALELANVVCEGRTVWTIGVEAIPGGPDLGSDMLAALVPLLRECPLSLNAENSAGYPAWLAGSGPTRSA